MFSIVTSSRQRFAALFLGLALCGGTARADILDAHLQQDGLGIEVGAIVQAGRTEFASNNLGLNPTSEGIVLRDRNGMSARMVIGLLIAIGGAMAQAGPKNVESHSYVSGDYIVTETTTTYYSEAEKAEMRENTAKAIDGVFSTQYSDMELHLYSRDRFGFGDTSGYKANFLVGTGESIALETGIGFGVADSIVSAAGTPTTLHWKYLGMPLRASVVAGPVRLAATYEWNWLKYGVPKEDRDIHMDGNGMPVAEVTSHPWHLEASTVVAKRVSVGAGATWQEIKKPSHPGYFVSAGVMF